MTSVITIRLVSYLKKIAGFKEKSFIIDKATKIGDLISFNISPERLVIILNHTEGGDLETIVAEDTYVLISPLFGGGVQILLSK